ncbi:hypothetical protein B0H13DRAFT_683881 [Mycena leptocephala]|nr:hypothetical protein B0H13DRAFT_683881 [Mycena leptocephala]
MKTFLGPLLLFAVVSLASEVETETTQPEPCTVRAWVRAEDLSPDHISRGELRIKAPRAECAHQIESVALRLQLDEFGEFKFLKKGVVLPEVQAANQSTGGYGDWMEGDVVYDYQAHDDGLSDPELWTVKAEERRAWMTEATLLENNPDLSNPIISPFTVAVPAVNYPPVIYRYRQLNDPVKRHAYSDLSYRYIAVVTFADGRTEHVQAGHTAFVPASEEVAALAPFTWNTTFTVSKCDWSRGDSPASKKRANNMERCLPEAQRSTFAAEITLEEGNVVRKGRPLKGRMTVRAIKDGSTTMSDISVGIRTVRRHHWAQAHAAAGGDAEFYNATSGVCQQSTGGQTLDTGSDRFTSVFDEDEDGWKVRRLGLESKTARSIITPPARQYFDFDFELQVPHDTPVDFASYYNSDENLLNFRLTVLYSPDVAKCIDPVTFKLVEAKDEISTVDDAAKIEEGLWDSFTRVGKPKDSTSALRRRLTLQARVPIIVVGDAPPVRAVAHYLTPDAPAPVICNGAQADPSLLFPVAQPVFTVEALANTSARLMQPGSTDPVQVSQQFMNMTRFNKKYPDPAQDYRPGEFAGLLWKKKIVAEERGIWPVRTEVVDGGDSQKPLSVSHLVEECIDVVVIV